MTTAIQVKWLRDTSAETHMKRFGVKSKLELIPISSIDIDDSRRNNARLQNSYNEELAMEYAIAMNDGSQFPAPVVRRVGRKYFTLSGNHRIGAAIECDQDEIQAHVVECSDEQAETIARAANRWMGDRQSKDEAVQHSLVLIDKYGRTVTECAKMFNLKESWLFSRVRAEKTRYDLIAKGVNVTGLSAAHMEALSPASYSDPVMLRAAQIAVKGKLTSSRTRDMVTEARNQASEKESLATLDRWNKEVSFTEKNSQTAVLQTPKRTKLMRALNTLHHYLVSGNRQKPFTKLTQLQITDDVDAAEVQRIWRETKRQFDGIFSGKASNGNGRG